ncbi:hypothetical protein TNCV_2295841 [Trichonephila clavipes]|nr:hypothetical protein TNCV_2295841 [Trichonephila clavipes]
MVRRGNKCGLPAVEPIPNKWRTTTPQLARDIAAMSKRRVFRQSVYRSLAETGLYAQCPVVRVPLTASSSKNWLLRSRKH